MNNQTEVKTRPSFGVLWQKYGTMGIFLLLLAVLTIAKPSSIFNPDSIPQILKQSAVNILLALGDCRYRPVRGRGGRAGGNAYGHADGEWDSGNTRTPAGNTDWNHDWFLQWDAGQ